ncbi:MAG TPA: hypothetical protein VNI02_09555 [Blastocatellia bacterium]|nr:hypothetical protein [Blastocatellia bacterium]
MLRYRSGKKLCSTCETGIDEKGNYILDHGIEPGKKYTLKAYDGVRWRYDTRDITPNNGDNLGIDFTLSEPVARVNVHGKVEDSRGLRLTSGQAILYLADCEECEITRVPISEEGEYKFDKIAAPQNYQIGLEVAGQLVGLDNMYVDTGEDQQFNLAIRAKPDKMNASETTLIATRIGPETVTVTVDTGAVAIVESTATILGGQVDFHRSVQETPILGRNYSDFILLNPGVNDADQDDYASNRGGKQLSEINRTVDGVSITDSLVRSDKSLISLSSVSEFRVFQAGPLPAYSGWAPGENTDVTVRSGGSEFHGEINYRVMNDAFSARNFFNLPGFDAFRNHEGWAKLSGPIWKSHSFFSFDYDFARRAEAPTFSSVLTSRISELNQRLARLGLPREDLRRFLTTSGTDLPIAHLNYAPAPNHRLSAIYSFRRDLDSKELSNAVGWTSGAPSTARDVSGRNHFLRAQHTWLLSSLAVNTVSYFYRANSVSITPVEPDEISLLIPGLAIIGRATNLNEGDGHRQSEHLLSEDLKLLHEKHSFNFGGQFGFDRNLFRFAAFESGRAIIPGLDALSSPAPVADLFQVGSGGSQVSFNDSVVNLYFQDDYRIKNYLTLNFGLRYKAEFPPGFQKKDLNGFQPRLGFAWAVTSDQKTVLRAGYAIYRARLPQLPIAFELLMGGQGLQPDTPMPVRRVSSFIGEQAATGALNEFLNGGRIPGGPQLATAYDRNSLSPAAEAFDINVQRDVRKIIFEISYAYRRGSHLLTSTNINLPPPLSGGDRVDFRNATINPAFAQVYEFETVGHSSYHGGTVRAWKHFGGGFDFDASYTLSRAIDDVQSGSFEATPENVFNRSNDRAVSDLNLSHNLNVSAFWKARKSSSTGSGLLRRALGTLYLSEFFQFQSGRYFNVLVGSDANHDGNPLTDRPLNTGRNTFLGQRYAQLDATLGSQIKVSDGSRLTLSVDFFNLFNRTNFASYNTVLGRDDLRGMDAKIVSGRRGLPDFDFRRPLAPDGFGLATRAHSPRRIQLGVKFSF